MGSLLSHVEPFIVMHGLSSCGTQALESVGSVDVAHRLSCAVEYGILCVPCIVRKILNHWITREVPQFSYVSNESVESA